MTFCTNYSKSSYGFTTGAAIIFKRGGGHTKVDCHANFANCDMFVVLIKNLFYLKFKAFRKWSDISTRKSQNCAFYIFLHTTLLKGQERKLEAARLILTIVLLVLNDQSNLDPIQVDCRLG